jgi:NADH dehydrogenase [ubiquinone] 1 alpha subcomplex assembly factor 2
MLQELQADLARQQRVKLNAAILEAKDEAERVYREQLEAPSHHSQAQPSSISQSVPRDRGMELPESDQGSAVPTRDPWAEALKRSDEPRSWTPIARKR